MKISTLTPTMTANESVDVATWIQGAVLVSLAMGLVGLAWQRRVFDRRYLATGPRRTLDVGPVMWWVALAMVVVPPMLTPLAQLDPHGRRALVQAAIYLAVSLSNPLLAVLTLIVLGARQPGGFTQVGLVPRRFGRELLWGLGLIVPAFIGVYTVSLVTSVISALFNAPAPTIGHEELRVIVEQPTLGNIIGIGVLAVVIAPIIEESCYRGLMQSLLLQWLGRGRRWWVVLIAGAFFGSIHVWAADWHALPGLFVLGVIFGVIYERTGSLIPSMVCHGSFNAINIAMVLMMNLPANPPTTPSPTPPVPGLGF